MRLALPALVLQLVLAGCNLEQERARRALGSEDPVQRAEALEKLAESGDRDIGPFVVPLLRDPSARVRKKAVAALGLVGVEPHLRQVIGRLNDADLEVRLTTVRVMGDSGLKAARPALLLALQDPSMVVRRAAGLALESLGMPRPVQVRELAREELEAQIKRLHHPDHQIRANAAQMVGLSERQEGLDPLYRLLSHRSPLVVAAAAQAVGRIGGPAALARLEGLARSSSSVERRAAAMGLSELAAPTPGAVQSLGRLVGDSDPEVQHAAARGLAQVGRPVVGKVRRRACKLLLSHRPGLARAVARVVRLGGGKACAEVDQLVQQAMGGDMEAVDVLSALGVAAVSKTLLELARRGYEEYRHGAVKWIAPDRWEELDDAAPGGKKKEPVGRTSPGESKRQALERLLARFPERSRERVTDPLLPPRVSAEAVARMIRALSGRPGTDAWLARVATEAALDLRVAALEALGSGAARGDGTAAEAVRLGLAAARAPIRAAALRSCVRLAGGALDAAVRLLADKDFDVRSAAARCLGRLGHTRGVKPLLETLEREHSVAAIRALARLGDHAATEPLLRMLQEDHASTRRDERVVVIEALGQLGDLQAARAVERELSHPAWQVRRAAALALRVISPSALDRALAICRDDYYAEVRRACNPARGTASQPASRPTPAAP